MLLTGVASAERELLRADDAAPPPANIGIFFGLKAGSSHLDGLRRA
jgi:hypothetical protein